MLVGDVAYQADQLRVGGLCGWLITQQRAMDVGAGEPSSAICKRETGHEVKGEALHIFGEVVNVPRSTLSQLCRLSSLSSRRVEGIDGAT